MNNLDNPFKELVLEFYNEFIREVVPKHPLPKWVLSLIRSREDVSAVTYYVEEKAHTYSWHFKDITLEEALKNARESFPACATDAEKVRDYGRIVEMWMNLND